MTIQGGLDCSTDLRSTTVVGDRRYSERRDETGKA
jgi:hypothetical protein